MELKLRIFSVTLVTLAAINAHATPMRNSEFLERAPTISAIRNQKELLVPHADGAAWKSMDTFVVVRQIKDPLRDGWFDFEFVGRAAVVSDTPAGCHLVLYKSFKSLEPKEGDRILRTGQPLTANELGVMQKEVLGILKRDKELEDLFNGIISIKLGNYRGSLSSTSKTSDGSPLDTNSFKQSDSYWLKTLGIRWWLIFNPAFGINFDYASGDIPTSSFNRNTETSTQTYLNPGLVYRGRFLMVPVIYSLTYFINTFKTSNPDDFLISSTYSGVNLGVTAFLPYRFKIFSLGPFQLNFNNLELGGGISPMVQISDKNYERGSSVSAKQVSYNFGIEFNLGIRGLKFLDNLFFVLEGGQQKYDLRFSGVTTGTLPDGTALPAEGVHTETQTWYGMRLKYNFPDFIGGMFYD